MQSLFRPKVNNSISIRAAISTDGKHKILALLNRSRLRKTIGRCLIIIINLEILHPSRNLIILGVRSNPSNQTFSRFNNIIINRIQDNRFLRLASIETNFTLTNICNILANVRAATFQRQEN